MGVPVILLFTLYSLHASTVMCHPKYVIY